MKKIIRICNKDFTMKSSAYTQFAYKDVTGRSLLHDIERFQSIDISNAVEAMDDMSETLLQMAYVMIEEAEDVNKPTSFIDFLKQLEEGLFDDPEWIGEVIELAASPLHTGNNKTN